MKKMIAALLAALLLCSCNGQTATTSSGTPAAEASTDENFIREIEGVKYFDVKAAAKATGTLKNKADPLFPENAEGYYIENGTYIVSADVMRRIIKKPFAGDGAIRWEGYNAGSFGGNEDIFDGDLPVSKIGDPLYELMCLPNEQGSYMETTINRSNAASLYPITDEYYNALPIGAVYVNPEKKLPDDAQVTLCFGNIVLLARTKDSDGWFLASETLCKPINIYPLPWTLENDAKPVQNIRMAPELATEVDGHYELKLTGADLNGTAFKDERVESSVLHFWGKFYEYEKGSDVLGVVAAYTVWVKEPEWAGYLTADVGVDIRGENRAEQAFTAINFTITDQPRVMYGHNVGPKAYDTVMDSPKVCEMIGLK